MARADMLAGKIERAVVDLAETILLGGHVGEVLDGVITEVDERGAKVQLCQHPVVARLATKGLMPGESVSVRLTGADQIRRAVTFEVAKRGTPV